MNFFVAVFLKLLILTNGICKDEWLILGHERNCQDDRSILQAIKENFPSELSTEHSGVRALQSLESLEDLAIIKKLSSPLSSLADQDVHDLLIAVSRIQQM